MSFDTPEFLWYLTGIPLIGLLLLASATRNRRVLTALTTRRREQILGSVLVVKVFITAILFSGALASLILALAGPRWGEVSVEDERRGLELVFLFDVSNSMAAQDILPSRLERSRETARAIAYRIPGAYSATVAFKGRATTIVPMTEDDVAFELAMSRLAGSLITAPGTNLEEGLRTAVDAFPGGSPRYRVIVLFTDGEQLAGGLDAVLEEIRIEEIPVIVVAAGTEGGAVIPTVDGGVIRDASGNPVIARVDTPTLRRIAETSNGSLYHLADRTVVQQISAELETRSGVGRQVIFRQSRAERYHLFVFLALALLILIVVVQSIRWRGAI